MNRRLQGMLVLLTGIVGLRLVATGQHLDYLRGRMTIPLLATGVLLVVLGTATMVADPGDNDSDGHDHGDGHNHSHGRLIAWLLALPILVVLVIAPAPLGADAVDTSVARAPTPAATAFEPLPEAIDGAVELDLGAFVTRALFDSEASLIDEPVRLIGFVADDDEGEFDFRLTRFTVSCCAADGYPIQVGVLDAPSVPAEDTWLEIIGVLDADLSDVNARLPVLRVTSMETIDAPAKPYI